MLDPSYGGEFTSPLPLSYRPLPSHLAKTIEKHERLSKSSVLFEPLRFPPVPSGITQRGAVGSISDEGVAFLAHFLMKGSRFRRFEPDFLPKGTCF